ncbi:hypothetical protein A4X13_0g6087, partial [Tilletia indica]
AVFDPKKSMEDDGSTSSFASTVACRRNLNREMGRFA